VICTKNAFGVRAPPGPAGGAIASPDLLDVIRGGEAEKGKDRVGPRAVRGLPRLRAPGIVPCIVSFSRQLPCFLMV